MKKTIQLTIVLLISTLSLFSQTNLTASADKYFNNLSYVKAAEKYAKLAEKKPTEHILKRLGDSYYYNVKMEEAAEAYAKLFANYTPTEAEYIFKYAQALRATGNDKESETWLQKFHETKLKDSRGTEFTDKDANLEVLKNSTPLYKVNNLEHINTENSDFGVTEYKNSILFSSTGKEYGIIKRIHTRNNKPFLNLYQVSKEKVNDTNDKVTFSEDINTKYHESSVSFSPDENTIYFTRNNFIKGKSKTDKDGYNNLKIYSAKFVDNKWQNITELPFCSDDYSVGHPAVSKDGKRLYFISDMPGSMGQTDIFYTIINMNGTFSEIKNLGPTINTEGREMFPFMAEDNTLYFSSDGHFGIGALDVFSSKLEKGDFQKPINLKAPVNSPLDDFAFSINPRTKKGYLSSNREEGAGDDDIYAVTELEYVAPVIEEPCFKVITGIVTDKKTQKPLPNARIILRNSVGTIIKDTVADSTGNFTHKLACNESFLIKGSKEYYVPETKAFNTGYTTEIKLNLAVTEEFSVNDVNQLIVKIDPIYFNFNSADIRPDAAIELDKVVAVMNKYPTMTIAGTSHTDARGSAAYNQLLSNRRAKSTVAYIISKGISPDRITDKGYGETRLTNNCTDNDTHSNTVKCTEKEHQANRRTEFIIN